MQILRIGGILVWSGVGLLFVVRALGGDAFSAVIVTLPFEAFGMGIAMFELGRMRARRKMRIADA